jgi:hypothetical protein
MKMSTPLRLPVAAEIAFPDGSISGKALWREAAKGRPGNRAQVWRATPDKDEHYVYAIAL